MQAKLQMTIWAALSSAFLNNSKVKSDLHVVKTSLTDNPFYSRLYRLRDPPLKNGITKHNCHLQWNARILGLPSHCVCYYLLLHHSWLLLAGSVSVDFIFIILLKWKEISHNIFSLWSFSQNLDLAHLHCDTAKFSLPMHNVNKFAGVSILTLIKNCLPVDFIRKPYRIK